MQFVTSLLYYIFFAVTGVPLILIALFIWLLTVLFDKKLRILHLFTQFWGVFLYSVVPSWKVSLEGKDKIDNDKVVIYISNHQSDFDIVLICHLFAYFKWVSKAEVFQAPIVGWNMKLNRYISLKRGTKSGVLKMINDCHTSIKNGISVFLFPEGTRSLDGQLGCFSSGAFALSEKAQCDIQPIVLSGTKDIMRKNSWKLNFKAKVKLKVLDRIPYETIKDKSVKEIEAQIKDLMAQELEELKASLD